MPMPTIKGKRRKKTAPKKNKGPTGLPKPRNPIKPPSSKKQAAAAAVKEYEVQRRVYDDMQEQWGQDYPEASEARESLLRQEDAVHEAIKIAKPLVAAGNATVGDFTVQSKTKKAHYDEEAITSTLGGLVEGGDIFIEMVESGAIKKVSLNRDAATAFFAQRPHYAEAFGDSWRKEEPDTAAVTVPKL